jgi:ATP-dependent DNA ligase
LLQINGKDLQNSTIEERKAKLEELLKKPPGVMRYSVSFTKDIPELLDRALKLGLEGLIGKRAGSRYEAGKRSGAWIKVKLHQEQEFVIAGYTEPEGTTSLLITWVHTRLRPPLDLLRPKPFVRIYYTPRYSSWRNQVEI